MLFLDALGIVALATLLFGGGLYIGRKTAKVPAPVHRAAVGGKNHRLVKVSIEKMLSGDRKYAFTCSCGMVRGTAGRSESTEAKAVEEWKHHASLYTNLDAQETPVEKQNAALWRELESREAECFCKDTRPSYLPVSLLHRQLEAKND